MILNSTKYKNPQRTIIGAINFVFNGDTIILCDTSLGIVNLTLLEIPNDQWNTTYKLYVVDSGNKAGLNNITINAPMGFTVNGASSLVISTNGATALIRVTSNTGYIASLSSGGSGGGAVSVVNEQNPFAFPTTLTTTLDKLIVKGFQTTNVGNDVTLENAFIAISSVQIPFLISNNLLIPNQAYNITDAVYGRSTILHNVYLLASVTNKLSTFGLAEFFNADYQQVGDYSGVTGFVLNVGIWNSTLAVLVGYVTIADNLMYVNLTGVNGINSPAFDPLNWQLLPYSQTNGYIVEIDEITYDLDKSAILSRKDKLLNYVEIFDDGKDNSLNVFSWGNALIYKNKVIGNSMFYCANISPVSSMSSNHLTNSLVNTTPSGLPASVDTFSSNIFIGNGRGMAFDLKDIKANIYQNEFHEISDFNATFGNCTFIGNIFTGQTFENSSFDGGCQIINNYFTATYINIVKVNGTMINNIANSSSFILNSDNGAENSNFLSCSKWEVVNKGNIIQNSLETNSEFKIKLNDTSGNIQYNVLQANSRIEIGTSSAGSIGNGVKSDGNLFIASSLTIQTMGGFKEISGNEFYNSTVSMGDMQGSLGLCTLKASSIAFSQMIGRSLVGLNLFDSTFGNGAYIVPQSFGGGVYSIGNSSIKANLDCSDPLIYDLPTKTLIIPNQITFFAGIFILENAGGLIIEKIAGLSGDWEKTILIDASSGSVTTNFKTISVAIASLYSMVSNLPPPYTYSVVSRISGSDFICVKNSGGVIEVTQVGIFL